MNKDSQHSSVSCFSKTRIKSFSVAATIFYVKKTHRFSLIILFYLLITGSGKAQNCTLNASVDQTICANEVLTLSGAKNGLFQGSGIATWSQISGPSTIITDPTSLSTTVTGIVGGNTYKFRLSSNCQDGSLVYDDVIIIVRPVSIANAGPDQSPICPGTGALAGSLLLAGETGVWTVSGANGSPSNNLCYLIIPPNIQLNRIKNVVG